MKRRFRRDLVVQVEANGWGRAEGHQVPPYILEALTEPIPEEEATGEVEWVTFELLREEARENRAHIVERHDSPGVRRSYCGWAENSSEDPWWHPYRNMARAAIIAARNHITGESP